MIAYFYSLIYAMPVSLLAVFAGRSYFDFPDEWMPVIVLSIVFSMMIAGVRHIEKKYRFLIIGIVLILLLGAYFVIKPDERIVIFQKYKWIGWMMILAIVSYLVGQLFITAVWVRRIAAVLLAAGAGIALFKGYEPEKAQVALGFFLIFVILAEEVQRSWKKSGHTKAKEHMVSVAPFLAIACVIVCRFPAPQEPYDWRVTRFLCELAVESANRVSGLLFHRVEEYGEVGFSENGEMAGTIGSSEKEVMELTGDSNSGSILYLSGRSFDAFDGRHWTVTAKEDAPSRLLDTLETDCAVRKYDPGYRFDYLIDTKVNIEYRLHNTRYLFLPPKAELSVADISGLKYEEHEDHVLAKKRLSYGTEYKIFFHRMNRNADIFRALLRTTKPIDEDDWYTELGRKALRQRSDCSYDQFMNYRKYINDTYKTDIVLSDEVNQCLEELFEGAESEIDKLERMEAWLHSFSYSTTPGKLPDHVQSPEQFLDYFLLEKQEGYCVHFASAFAMLARAEGFPTRYVQGYCVKGANGKTVTVTSNMAHAWPEVYIENVGWIPFEPTPGYEPTTQWKIQDREKTNPVNYHQIPKKTDSADVSFLPETTETVQKGSNDNWRIILLPVAGAIIFLILYLLVYRLIIQRKNDKLDAQDKAIALCKRNLKRLSMIGWKLKPGETLEEFGSRISEEIPESVTCFIDCYERMSYAQTQITPEMLAIIEASDKELLALLKKKNMLYRLFVW
ncbi:MAG: transglutaminaseTgpA domain-containing protein [bacterium]|nr:transglutaminaseTgpA domain-containing protein [bacterium]